MIDIGTDELYELASIAKSDPYGHPYEQVLDNFDNFRCLMTPSLIMWLIDSLREAERDAARYKYLKSDHKTKNLYSYQQDMKDRYWDEDIDSGIDQAMKEQGDE